MKLYAEVLPKFYTYWHQLAAFPRGKSDAIELSVVDIVDTVDDFCRGQYFNNNDPTSIPDFFAVKSGTAKVVGICDVMDICDMLTSLGDEEMT
jgi:hypothetical protein